MDSSGLALTVLFSDFPGVLALPVSFPSHMGGVCRTGHC